VRKDLKTGMLIGMLLVTIAMVWFSTRPSLTVQSRVLRQISRQSISHDQNTPYLRFSLDVPAQPTKPPARLLPAPKQLQSIKPAQLDAVEAIKYTPDHRRIKTQKFHTVRSGETLSDIAKKYYGTTTKWLKIYNANRQILKNNPNQIKPGMKLVIPD